MRLWPCAKSPTKVLVSQILPAPERSAVLNLGLCPGSGSAFCRSDYRPRLRHGFISKPNIRYPLGLPIDNPPHGMRAIYVPMEGNDNVGRVRELVPIYIRPSKHTLYIPFLQRIDWDAFLARKENQCLQHFSITSTTAVSMVHDPKFPSWGLKELKNLKSILYLVGHSGMS
jgi:hypothetical protein